MDNRTMTLTRTFRADPATVYAAWTDPAVLPKWFGPEGFYCVTHDIDLREGGHWLFDMIGHGMTFANRHRYLRLVPHSLIEFLMDDGDDQAEPMVVTVTVAAEGAGTLLTHQVRFPSAEAYYAAKGYNAEAMGYTTLAKLAAELGE